MHYPSAVEEFLRPAFPTEHLNNSKKKKNNQILYKITWIYWKHNSLSYIRNGQKRFGQQKHIFCTATKCICY